MKFHYLLLSTILFTLSTIKLSGQTNKPCNNFDCAYKKAENFLKQAAYQKALDNLDSAEGYLTDTNTKEKEQIKQLRRRLFVAIEKEKEEAKKARDEAKRQTEIAKNALILVEKKTDEIKEKNQNLNEVTLRLKTIIDSVDIICNNRVDTNAIHFSDSLPLKYKIPFLPSIKDMGASSATVGYSIAYAITTQIVNDIDIKKQKEIDSLWVSPYFIYNQVKLGKSCLSGALLSEAFRFVLEKGICLNYDFLIGNSHCDSLPNEALSRHAISLKILFKNYFKAFDGSDNTLQKISKIRNYLIKKTPIVIGYKVTENLFRLEKENLWKPDWINMQGSSCLVIIGYDDFKNELLLANSWGIDWGNEGLVRIKYEDFNKVALYGYVLDIDKPNLINLKDKLALKSVKKDYPPSVKKQ